jgi:2-keto-4-pentenoate hydratase
MSGGTVFDPAPAAALLAAAWRSGEQMIALPAAMRPQTLAQGYALQDRLIAAMDDPPSGWKLGVGNPAAMRHSGLGKPLIGRVLGSRVHRSGDSVRVPGGGAPITFEFEIAFVLARDIVPTTVVEDPMSVVASTCTTFELVRSRFVDRLAVGWPSFAGDSVGFEALVVGADVDAGQIDAIARSVVVERDGVEIARGLSGDALTDPIGSLGALLTHAREYGVTLKRGEIVTTGVVAKPFDFSAGGEFVARFDGGEMRAVVR